MEPAHDAPDAADTYYAAKRSGTSDPQRAYAKARAQMRRVSALSTQDSALPWTFLGPSNVAGRTRTLVVDPVDTNVMYAGGVSGGVWKTTTAGDDWQPAGDDLVNLAVNSMAMDPRDRNTLYVGTGEGYFREEVRGTGLPLRGNGIFVTRDSAATWQQLPSTSTADFQWVNDLAISVHDSRRIYAGTRSGVWRSADGGTTWTNVLPTTVRGGCLDLALRTDVPGDSLFASCGTFDQATIYLATNAERENAWTPVLSEPDQGRTTLAIAPSKPSTVYALAASNTDQALLAVYRSDANGDPGSWTPRATRNDTNPLNTILLTNALSAWQCQLGKPSPVTMGWYCNTIAVDPADPERVYAAGVDLFRSDDGGTSWGLASYWWGDSPSHVHADQHNIVFDPQYDGGANQTLYLTNDGGIYRTDNARAAVATGPSAPCAADNSKVQFRSLVNNFGVTQFYSGAVSPDGRRYLGGAQDNATLVGNAGSLVWSPKIGGDGGYVAVDPLNPHYVYAEYQWGEIYRSNDGGVTFNVPAMNGLSDEFLFVTPFAIDAAHPTTLWTGGRYLWRTDNRGALWTRASEQLDAQVSAIAVSDMVFAGTTAGSIYNGAQRVHPRDGWVSSIALDPTNASTMYATYAGFGGAHVWRSVDRGATWNAIDGTTLPDIPIHSIAVDPWRPTRLYLGTDLGVFATVDGGAHWTPETFAPVVTEMVVIGQGARGPALYAFTHWRGAWRAELSPSGGRSRAVRH
ncbi:MAG TPA: hypothetical protein VLU46_11450 [Thermoanaerobaculia bacterium]|nr:hypothetical protein [Thermoanaerobaculia bacterium]